MSLFVGRGSKTPGMLTCPVRDRKANPVPEQQPTLACIQEAITSVSATHRGWESSAQACLGLLRSDAKRLGNKNLDLCARMLRDAIDLTILDRHAAVLEVLRITERAIITEGACAR